VVQSRTKMLRLTLRSVPAIAKLGRPDLRTKYYSVKSVAGSGTGRGPVTWPGLTAAAIAGLACTGYYQIEKDRLQTLVATKQKTVGKPSLGGPWTLVDSDGRPATEASMASKFVLLYFGFTRCPDICPSELVKVGKVLDRLTPHAGKTLETLFVSIDPQRDTLKQLRAYSQDFHPTIKYLTGTPDQIAQITKAFRVCVELFPVVCMNIANV